MVSRSFCAGLLTLSLSALITAQEVSIPVGTNACRTCHVYEQRSVAGTPHESGKSCESCHGPGSQHVKSGGDAKTIFSYRRAGAPEVREKCGQCHANPVMSRHAEGDVSCLACHSSHHYLKKKYLLRPADNWLERRAALSPQDAASAN